MRLPLHLIALALMAVAIAGCGGDDGEDTTAPSVAPPVETTASVTKEDLIEQGDAICGEVNAAVGTLASTEAEGAANAAALYGGMAERLEDLGAPSDDTAGYSDFLAATQALAQAESDVELAAERDEEESLATAEAEASSALASFQAAASDYGFEECGEGPSSPAAGGAAPEGGVEPEVESEAPEEGEAAEEAPEVEEVAPETGGAGSADEGGGAEAGGTEGGGGEVGGDSGGIGPG
ncbi:MAG TPA: hypothetical protein VFU04_00470 [Solirubrobacterales bacterium]|nr:hypothetical protein [Solirubrobacterales bacterium]